MPWERDVHLSGVQTERRIGGRVEKGKGVPQHSFLCNQSSQIHGSSSYRSTTSNQSDDSSGANKKGRRLRFGTVTVHEFKNLSHENSPTPKSGMASLRISR